jgi:hypothetical protein
VGVLDPDGKGVLVVFNKGQEGSAYTHKLC